MWVFFSGRDTILENIILHTQLFGWKIFYQFYLQLPRVMFKQKLLQGERVFIKTVKFGREILPRTTSTVLTYGWTLRRYFNIVLAGAHLSGFHPNVPCLLPLGTLEGWRVEWILLRFDLWFQSIDSSDPLFRIVISFSQWTGQEGERKAFQHYPSFIIFRCLCLKPEVFVTLYRQTELKPCHPD